MTKASSTAYDKTQPFVKWAGGERQLLPAITDRLPQNWDSYFEPFIGGGAVLFDLQPEHAVINDINEALVNLYKQVQSSVETLMIEVDTIDQGLASASDPKEYYYSVRARYNAFLSEGTHNLSSAALLLFLNKHCFNGLYRVNAKGLFNVPYNGSSAVSYSKENLIAASKYLSSVTILRGDFEAACAEAKKGDFVFFDSPYAPLNPTSFEAYTKEGFSREEHIRLSNLFKELTERGCHCMLTNHNTPFIRDLYQEFTVEEVQVRRSINSDASKRTGTEVIVRNY